jgi:hypothetical protein
MNSGLGPVEPPPTEPEAAAVQTAELARVGPAAAPPAPPVLGATPDFDGTVKATGIDFFATLKEFDAEVGQLLRLLRGE